jgi:hypothetical protein
MTRRQAGTMLHPEAQASAEHRIKHHGAHRIHPMSPVVSASRQSGLQSSAWSQHHLGASFSLAHSHYTDMVIARPNNLKPVSTFRGEDHTLPVHNKGHPQCCSAKEFAIPLKT